MTPHSTQDRLSGGGCIPGAPCPARVWGTSMLAISYQPYCVDCGGFRRTAVESGSPLTASQYIMVILGVTLKSCRAESCSSDDRVRAATVIRMFPEIIHSSRPTGMRRKTKAVKHLLAGKLYRYRRGPKHASGRLRQRGQCPDRQKTWPCRSWWLQGSTCDMRQLSFDAKETSWAEFFTNPP